MMNRLSNLSLEDILLALSHKSPAPPEFVLEAQADTAPPVQLDDWWESPLRLRLYIYPRQDVCRFVFVSDDMRWSAMPLFFVYCTRDSRRTLLTQFNPASSPEDELFHSLPVDLPVGDLGYLWLQTFAICGIPIPIRRLFRSGENRRDVDPELFAAWWDDLLVPPPNPQGLLNWLNAQLEPPVRRAFESFAQGDLEAFDRLSRRYDSAKPLLRVWLDLHNLLRG